MGLSRIAQGGFHRPGSLLVDPGQTDFLLGITSDRQSGRAHAVVSCFSADQVQKARRSTRGFLM